MSDLKFHTQELLISSGMPARELFESMNVEEKQADLVAGLWFKNGKHLFCWVEPWGEYFCAVYLDFKGRGGLSSFHTDRDYGKGSFVEYVVRKPVTGKGKLYNSNKGVNLEVDKELADFLLSKMVRVRREGTKYQGKHITCFKDKGTKCLVEIPFKKYKPEGDKPQVLY